MHKVVLYYLGRHQGVISVRTSNQIVGKNLRRNIVGAVGKVRQGARGHRSAFAFWLNSVDASRFIIGSIFLVLFSIILLVPSPFYPHHYSLTWHKIVGIPSTVFLMMALLVMFGLRFHKRLYDSTARLSLIGIVSAGCVIGMRLDTWLPHRTAVMPIGWAELTAITTAAAILTLMIDARTAMLCSASLIVFGAFLTAHEAPGQMPLAYTSVASLGSALIAIYSFHLLQSRTALVKGSLTVVLGNAAICVLLQYACGQGLVHTERALLFTTVASSAAIICFFSGVALLERPLGITTYLGLLELSDLNRPLLRQFCLEAPGSYAHSMMVANLAAAAAEAIGANALLARVGSYYHDVGKMRRAEFFIENQAGRNVHETMTPSLSAVVLTAHVREGMVIAEKEHLPPAIKDIIEQHHGTSLIKYFYERAASSEVGGCSLEQRFRYPGPKPQSKEAAVVMLADSIEAASHTLARPTAARIEELVNQITDNMIADGQLDESTLLIRDLTAIKSSFMHLLCGMMHRRIEYPAPATLRYCGGGLHDSGLFARMSAPLPTKNETTASTRPFAEEPPLSIPTPAASQGAPSRRKHL
jgi:putative nucleotidyltransferase with HDIG domain